MRDDQFTAKGPPFPSGFEKAFQEQEGIGQTGVVDAVTWERLSALS